MAAKKRSYGKKRTPVTYRGSNMDGDSVRNFMEEWSLRQAEANHVETIEEANDFEIFDDEDEDLFNNLTVYEMHEAAEDNLALIQKEQDQLAAESNETGDQGADDPHSHAQSAPVEPNSPRNTDSLSKEGDSPTNEQREL